MAKLKFIISSFFLFLIGVVSLSAQVSVRASIDSTDIKIGEQAQIRVDVVSSADENLSFPAVKQGDVLGGGVEVLAVSDVQTGSDNGKKKMSRDYLVTAFDSGSYVIPPFVLARPDSSKVQSNEVQLNVHGISEPIKEGEFKDIQPVYEPPFDWKMFFIVLSLLVLGLVAIVVAVYFLYVYIKKKRNQIAPVPVVEERKLTPAEKALQELMRIKEEKIWRQGQEKFYYTEITDVLRTYLHERFQIATLEKTSSEILDSLRYKEEAEPVLDKLRQIFSVSDMVKFAKVHPSDEENELSIVNALFVVNQTVVLEHVVMNATADKVEGN